MSVSQQITCPQNGRPQIMRRAILILSTGPGALFGLSEGVRIPLGVYPRGRKPIWAYLKGGNPFRNFPGGEGPIKRWWCSQNLSLCPFGHLASTIKALNRGFRPYLACNMFCHYSHPGLMELSKFLFFSFNQTKYNFLFVFHAMVLATLT